MRALVTGATGFVGRRLVAKLDKPVVLSRDAAAAARSLGSLGATAHAWNPLAGPPPEAAFDGVEAVFHLAGDPVAEGRWSAAKKQRIRDSRIQGTRNLVTALRGLARRPQVLVSASAVGYYGSRGGAEITEQSPPGSDFLADVCVQWEREAAAARELGMRVVPVRIGIVLGPQGGALTKMLTPFRLGLGSPLGSGRQYMPWIHLHDLVDLMLFAARHATLNEPVNGAAPQPVTNREFTRALGRALRRPTVLPPVPRFALQLMLGEFAEVLLASQRVIPQTAAAAGFKFQYPELQPALEAILRRDSAA